MDLAIYLSEIHENTIEIQGLPWISPKHIEDLKENTKFRLELS